MMIGDYSKAGSEESQSAAWFLVDRYPRFFLLVYCALCELVDGPCLEATLIDEKISWPYYSVYQYYPKMHMDHQTLTQLACAVSNIPPIRMAVQLAPRNIVDIINRLVWRFAGAGLRLRIRGPLKVVRMWGKPLRKYSIAPIDCVRP